jgi:hypothetical protein
VPPKTAAPRAEKGYVSGVAGAGYGWGMALDQFETVPDLLWPNSVYTYSRMAREDARIASVLRAVGLPIRRTAWRICQNGASDEVTAFVSKNLGLPIEGADSEEPTTRLRDRFSWQAHLRDALSALKFGHAVFEQVYRIEGEGSSARAVLRKLAPRPQSSISYWNVARDGGLLSVQQWPAGTFTAPGMFVMAPTSMGSAIEISRLVVYTHEPDPGVWTGNSLLRPAFKHWRLKDELMRIEVAAAQRHGIGVPWIKGNESDSEDDARMDDILSLASQYRGGSSAGLALTFGEEAGIMSPSGTPMDPRRAIEYHDHQMALVALAHFLNLEGSGGSYALASVQADTFVQSVQTVADDIRDTAQAHIVEDLVDLNFGPDEPSPLLVFDEIGSRQDATAAALQMLVNSKLLTPDDRLEQFLRSAAGLPSPDAESAREEQPPEAPAPPDFGDGGDSTPAPPSPPAADDGAQARLRDRGRSPRDRRKQPNGAIPLW